MLPQPMVLEGAHERRLGVIDLVKRYKVIAFVGPSAAGKTSLVNELRQADPRFGSMLSVTTRAKRDTDLPGEYRYITVAHFSHLVATEQFLWTTNVHQNRYGTLRESMRQALAAMRPTVMHLEPDCVPKLLAEAEEQACLFFITAPPHDLERRIRVRDLDRSEEYYRERLDSCAQWEEQARNSQWPYRFVNNGDGRLKQALAEVMAHITRDD